MDTTPFASVVIVKVITDYSKIEVCNVVLKIKYI